MKRLWKTILIGILACLMIAGSVIGTSAYSIERVIYDGCGSNSPCLNGADAQNKSCPKSISDLYDLLKRCGCPEDVCRQISGYLGGCGAQKCPPQQNGCDADCVQIPDNTCEKNCTPAQPEPTEPETIAEEDTPVEEPTSAPTEAPQVQPTEAPTLPVIKPTEPIKPAGYALNSYETEVVRLINEIRAQYGLGALSINTELSRVARIKSQDMHDKGYFSHTSPTYGSPFEMMTAFGIRYRTAGENIAVGYRTPQSVVDGWMNSEGHRRNILNGSFTQIGMGYTESGNYWTQMFIG